MSSSPSRSSRNVVLTGANDSVGRIIAEAFHARGDRVHICGRTPAKVESTVAANRGMRGTVADVGTQSDVDRLFDEALEWMGRVDVLVNIAHDSGPRAPIEQIDLEDWSRCFDVNVHGAFYCLRRALPGMKERRQGSIINYSTASTRTAVPLRSPYVATKSAVEGLTRTLARELGPFNVRCNAILPGAIDNKRFRKYVERNAQARGMSAAEYERSLFEYISLRRSIEMSEFADLTLFLASDAASGITGQLIELGGNVEWEAG